MVMAIHGRIYSVEGWVIDNPLVRDSRVLNGVSEDGTSSRDSRDQPELYV